MGKCMRKSKEISEIAVMEVAPVGVRTRARTQALASSSASTGKRRKVGSVEMESPSSFPRLQSDHRVVVTPEKPTWPAMSGNCGQPTAGGQCSSPSSGDFLASRCSSNGSIGLASEMLRSVNLEGSGYETEDSTSFDSKESSNCTSEEKDRQSCTSEMATSNVLRPKSDYLESTACSSESLLSQTSSPAKEPSEDEIEQFFSIYEEDNREKVRRSSDKYNFDFENEVLLDGRYEWARLKP